MNVRKSAMIYVADFCWGLKRIYNLYVYINLYIYILYSDVICEYVWYMVWCTSVGVFMGMNRYGA